MPGAWSGGYRMGPKDQKKRTLVDEWRSIQQNGTAGERNTHEFGSTFLPQTRHPLSSNIMHSEGGEGDEEGVQRRIHYK